MENTSHDNSKPIEIEFLPGDHTVFNREQILGFTTAEILKRINAINAFMIGLPEYKKPEKRGAILRIAQMYFGRRPKSIFLDDFGHVIGDKLEKYTLVSLRKILQLHHNPSHISSHQSRDGVNLWGGGYPFSMELPGLEPDKPVVNHYALSISGYNEHGDETSGLMLGLELGWIELPLARAVAAISNNDLFRAFNQKA